MNRSRALAFVFVAVLVACSSSPGTPPSTGAAIDSVGPKDIGFGFTVYAGNTTGRSVWMTEYWSYKSDVNWHIERAICHQGGTWTSAIQYHFPELGPQIKMRAEVTDGPGCSGSKLADVWSDKCDLSTSYLNNPIASNYGYITLRYDGKDYKWDQFHNTGGFQAPSCK
jgi:hypothetical protein